MEQYVAFAEKMVSQCLPFYLNHSKSVLLTGEYPRVHEFVRNIRHVSSMHEHQFIKLDGQQRVNPIKAEVIQLVHITYNMHSLVIAA